MTTTAKKAATKKAVAKKPAAKKAPAKKAVKKAVKKAAPKKQAAPAAEKIVEKAGPAIVPEAVAPVAETGPRAGRRLQVNDIYMIETRLNVVGTAMAQLIQTEQVASASSEPHPELAGMRKRLVEMQGEYSTLRKRKSGVRH